MAAEQTTPPKLDWIYLPAGVEATSLWVSLHDAELTRLITNPATGAAMFEFDVPYVWQFHGLPPETRFELEFMGVSSLRATRFVPPPMSFIEIDGEDPESRGQRIRDYHEIWREESIAWSTWAQEVAAGDEYTVSQAELASDSMGVSVHIGGFSESSSVYTDVWLRAKSLQFSLDGKTPLKIDDFVELGGKYWDDFGKPRS